MKGSFSIFCIGIIMMAPNSVDGVDYEKDIKPILKSRCVSCHGPIKQKAGLRVDAGKWIHEGSEDGSILKGANGHSAALVDRIATSDEDDRMPPEGAPLSALEIKNLKQWVAEGAPFPEEEVVAVSPKEHWAFQVVERPPLPKVKEESWVRNEIDRFVLGKLEGKEWKPAPGADQEILLRRIYLDLTGLPPDIDEQTAFAEFGDLDRVIDDLLSRPAYGERWARHWLDAVRYGDTNGYERDAIKPFVWRYRDYVIDSFNADKPYDRFLIEQLAGDELPDANAETIIATGFLRLGYWDDEPADPETDRFDQLDDIVSTTSLSMLGLTMGCARCHDHKFEPLLQKDYYAMLAVFNPLERPRQGRKELAIPAGTKEEVRVWQERESAISEIEKQSTKLRSEFERVFLEEGRSSLPGPAVTAFLAKPEKRNAAQKDLVKEHSEALEAELKAAMPKEILDKFREGEERIERLQRSTPDIPLAYAWKECSGEVPETHILIRGQAGRNGEVVSPAEPVILSSSLAAAFPVTDKTTTKRRLGFASWMVDPKNPLTARVCVNRVWMHHFGEGLVRTPNNFGLMGEYPSHPELLDWLSHWFVHEAEWSLKKLHRLILTSNTWRMSNRDENSMIAGEDSGNRFLSRQNYRRLEVEAIRDSILAVSGKLNRSMHGPHTYPSVPPQALEGHSDPEAIWKPLDEESASRRTVYAFVKRSLMIPMLEVLDVCDTTQPSPGRRVTTVAPQALTLYNGEFANRQAGHFAARLRVEAGENPADQIELAFRLALCRPPRPDESKLFAEFLKQETLEQACRVIFNLNEFVYPE